EAAPAPMIKLYGPSNGFGWKLNDVVGAQVVSVPMTLPIRNAERAFFTFMGSLTAVFALVFIVLNVMLSRMIVQPIARMSKAADQVSTGNFDLPELPEAGRDEVAVLGRAFNRMRRSLQKALQMIEGWGETITVDGTGEPRARQPDRHGRLRRHRAVLGPARLPAGPDEDTIQRAPHPGPGADPRRRARAAGHGRRRRPLLPGRSGGRALRRQQPAGSGGGGSRGARAPPPNRRQPGPGPHRQGHQRPHQRHRRRDQRGPACDELRRAESDLRL